ncbi:MAG: Hcp1 family type secretion system effector [Myxococcales bacterium]|jgi:type VI secretion system secreted protein Hcp|nr:Hcp1 family type secretion system effector [Myxococcales bacterium]
MAVDMFIKIGDIKGESTDSTHGDSIDVINWNWGMSQSGTTHTGTGSGAGKVAVHDLTFTKHVDVSTPTLLQACAAGKHFPTGTFTVRKAGDKPLEYFKITFHDLIVSNIAHGGTGSDDRQTETVTINFGQFEVAYTSQTKTGGAGPTVPMSWNIPGNTDKIKK